MGKLGMKISRAFNSLGNKVSKVTTKIGDKTNNIIKETKGVANVLKKKTDQIGNSVSSAVNKIPELNDKAIRLGNNIINKSGAITDALRKGSGIAATLTNGLAQIGGDVPLVGSALKAGAKATDLLAKGARKLDRVRDDAAGKLGKYSTVSRDTINDIEKLNTRKKIAAQEMESSNPDDGFA